MAETLFSQVTSVV